MAKYRVEIKRLPKVVIGKVNITPALLFVGYTIRDRSNVYPPQRRNHGGLEWTSRRQKLHVLAKVRLPYRRRGYLAKMWLVTPVKPARVIVRNAAPYASFVIGERQQKYHKITGWPRFYEVAEDVAKDRNVIATVAGLVKREAKRRQKK